MDGGGNPHSDAISNHVVQFSVERCFPFFILKFDMDFDVLFSLRGIWGVTWFSSVSSNSSQKYRIQIILGSFSPPKRNDSPRP